MIAILLPLLMSEWWRWERQDGLSWECDSVGRTGGKNKVPQRKINDEWIPPPLLQPGFTLFHSLEIPFSPASEPEQESLSLISLIHTLCLSLSTHQLGRVTDTPRSLCINAAWSCLHETPSLALSRWVVWCVCLLDVDAWVGSVAQLSHRSFDFNLQIRHQWKIC